MLSAETTLAFRTASRRLHGERTHSIVGTPDYLAPEVIGNLGHSYSVDYWALGVLLYELLFGVPPFTGDSLLALYRAIIKGESISREGVLPSARVLAVAAPSALHAFFPTTNYAFRYLFSPAPSALHAFFPTTNYAFRYLFSPAHPVHLWNGHVRAAGTYSTEGAIGKSARDVIRNSLLVSDPEKRVADGRVLVTHRFFAPLSLAKLDRQEIEPPYVPPQAGLQADQRPGQRLDQQPDQQPDEDEDQLTEEEQKLFAAFGGWDESRAGGFGHRAQGDLEC